MLMWSKAEAGDGQGADAHEPPERAPNDRAGTRADTGSFRRLRFFFRYKFLGAEILWQE